MSSKEIQVENIIEQAKEYIKQHLSPIIHQAGEYLEGNLFSSDLYLQKVKNISHLLLDEDIKKVMEIGFNSGFSTLLMLLSNPQVNITCYDLVNHGYMMPCYLKLKETFGDRVHLVIGNSMETLKHDTNTYDLILIDGGHETHVAENDIQESYRLSKDNTILIMDDYDYPQLHALWDQYVEKYALQTTFVPNTPYHDIKMVRKS